MYRVIGKYKTYADDGMYGMLMLTVCIIYSEENVWQLCKDVLQRHPTEIQYCYTVFISNPSRTVPLWRQRAGRDDDRLVIWVRKHIIDSYTVYPCIYVHMCVGLSCNIPVPT